MNEITKTQNLARVVADITGDGHLQIQGWRHLISFYSKDLEEIEAAQKRFYELFGLLGKVYVDHRKNIRYKLFFISKPVALFLRNVGTPVGNKTNVVFFVPKWIFCGSQLIKSAYLQGLFDSEGSVFCRKGVKRRWQIGFKMAKNEQMVDSEILYLNQIRKMLMDFRIHCSPIRKNVLNLRKDGSRSFEFQFNIEKSSFRNFYKYVGFGHKAKRTKLLLALSECADSQAAKFTSTKRSGNSKQSPAVPL